METIGLTCPKLAIEFGLFYLSQTFSVYFFQSTSNLTNHVPLKNIIFFLTNRRIGRINNASTSIFYTIMAWLRYSKFHFYRGALR